MTLFDRAIRLLSQFIDAARDLLSPRRSTLTHEQHESIARSLEFLSAETTKQPAYTAGQFYARYMKPLADARTEALKKTNQQYRL
jgi:hypothetical protein